MIFFSILIIFNKAATNYIKIKCQNLPYPYDVNFDPDNPPTEIEVLNGDYVMGYDIISGSYLTPKGIFIGKDFSISSDTQIEIRLYLNKSPMSNNKCNNDVMSNTKTYFKTLHSTTDPSSYNTVGYSDFPSECKQCETGKRHCETCNTYNTECTACDDPEKYDVEPTEKLYCVRKCDYFTENYIEYSQCLECSTSKDDEILCGSCDDGYYLENQKCIECSYKCWTCTSSSICTNCRPGYYLEHNTCHPCPENLNCRTCSFKEGTSELKCDTCNPDSYSSDDGACISCPETCASCKNNQGNIICTNCYAGYYLQNNECKQCNEDKHCNSCPDSPDVCDLCLSGYYKNNDGDCISCNINECSTCSFESNQVTCLFCNNGFYLDEDHQCVQCPPNLGCSICGKDRNYADKIICLGCTDGYYEDTSHTCASCPSNCLNCYPVGENIKCTKCIDNRYEIKDDRCVLKACDPSGMDHCSACIFSQDGETKECTSCDLNSYEVSEDKLKCVLKTCVPSGMDHCSACIFSQDGETKECTSCDSNNYEVSEDKLKCILKTCVPSGMDHCSTCIFSQDGVTKECTACDSSDYEISDDKSKCEKQTQTCDPSQIKNCIKCKYEGQNIICQKCTDGFEPSNNIDECVPISGELTPIPIPEVPLPDGSSTLSEDKKTQTITTEKITNPDNSKVYTEPIGDSVDTIYIKNENNANLHISIPYRNEITTIVPDNDGTKVTLVVDSQTTIQIKNAASTTINTNTHQLTINGVEDDTNSKITVGKIVPNQDLVLNTDKKLVIKELQIFQYKTFYATENSVTIEKVKIEQGGTFKPLDNTLQIQNIEIGLESNLRINDAIKDSNIIVYYNGPQNKDSQMPLSYDEDLSTALPKSLTIRRKELGTLLEEKDFILIQQGYPKNMHDDIKKVCNGWEKTYDSSNSPFKSLKCQYLENAYSEHGITLDGVQLVATNKKDSKNGLPAGAIAGIVIACIIVVGVAIFLGVYFGIIRKNKNNDISEDQNDNDNDANEV